LILRPSDLDLQEDLQNLSNNEIISLNLPPDLQILDCAYNLLTSLNNLPPTLQSLYCANNQLTSLNNLPPTLRELYCENNPIYTTCKEIHGFTLSVKTIEKYNEIKRIENLENECCPLLK